MARVRGTRILARKEPVRGGWRHGVARRWEGSVETEADGRRRLLRSSGEREDRNGTGSCYHMRTVVGQVGSVMQGHVDTGLLYEARAAGVAPRARGRIDSGDSNRAGENTRYWRGGTR